MLANQSLLDSGSLLLNDTGDAVIEGRDPHDHDDYSIQLLKICDTDIAFEIMIDTYDARREIAQQQIKFSSRFHPDGSRVQLDADIRQLCEQKRVSNCAFVSDLIHAGYSEKFSDMLESSTNPRDCLWIPSVSTVTAGPPSSFPEGARRRRAAADIVQVVSGYWRVNDSKYSQLDYDRWLRSSLRINMPYIIFTNSDCVDLITDCRLGLPTLIALRDVPNMVAYPTYQHDWILPGHVPSKEVACIWLEKMHLLLLASRIAPPQTTFFAWVDAGLVSFRKRSAPDEPWSSDVIGALPRDRVAHSLPSITYFQYHNFAAGVLIMHRDILPRVHTLFYAEYGLCRKVHSDWRCGSEQYLFSQLRKKHPSLFHAMSYDYGDIDFLWANRYKRVGNDAAE